MTGLLTDSDLHRQWGQNLRAARLAAGLDQAELAERLGTYQQLISRWETGRAPKDSIRPRLAAALGVPVHELFPYPAEVAA